MHISYALWSERKCFSATVVVSYPLIHTETVTNKKRKQRHVPYFTFVSQAMSSRGINLPGSLYVDLVSLNKTTTVSLWKTGVTVKGSPMVSKLVREEGVDRECLSAVKSSGASFI